MTPEFIPKIRLEIDAMKASIIQCMGLNESEMAKAIEQAVEEKIACYDFRGHVYRLVEKSIDETLNYMFSCHGEIGTLIWNSVREAVLSRVQVDIIELKETEK